VSKAHEDTPTYPKPSKGVNRYKLDAGVMEAIAKGPAFGDRKPRKTDTCICPIVKNLTAHNSGTIGVMIMKHKLDV
jgi:hypothetical protein